MVDLLCCRLFLLSTGGKPETYAEGRNNKVVSAGIGCIPIGVAWASGNLPVQTVFMGKQVCPCHLIGRARIPALARRPFSDSTGFTAALDEWLQEQPR